MLKNLTIKSKNKDNKDFFKNCIDNKKRSPLEKELAKRIVKLERGQEALLADTGVVF